MIVAGADLVAHLDETTWPVAFWLDVPEKERWRLVFASPRITHRGSREGYQLLQQALRDVPEAAARVSIFDMQVLPLNAPLVNSICSAVGARSGVNRVPFRETRINGIWIGDALVYRMDGER